jgi:hypothetical protein
MKGICRFCGQSDLWALGIGGLMGFFDWPLLQGMGRMRGVGDFLFIYYYSILFYLLCSV